MTAAVAITRMDLSAAELRMAAAATRNGHVARRLLALALPRSRRTSRCGSRRTGHRRAPAGWPRRPARSGFCHPGGRGRRHRRGSGCPVSADRPPPAAPGGSHAFPGGVAGESRRVEWRRSMPDFLKCESSVCPWLIECRTSDGHAVPSCSAGCGSCCCRPVRTRGAGRAIEFCGKVWKALI